MKEIQLGDYFLKEQITQIEDSYAVSLDMIAAITGLDKARIVSDALEDHERQQLFSLVSGFLILDYQIDPDDLLAGLLNHLHVQYHFSYTMLASITFQTVEAIKAPQNLSIDEKYRILAYLNRLHTIVSQADPMYGKNIMK